MHAAQTVCGAVGSAAEVIFVRCPTGHLRLSLDIRRHADSGKGAAGVGDKSGACAARA